MKFVTLIARESSFIHVDPNGMLSWSWMFLFEYGHLLEVFFFGGECSKVVPKSEVNPDVCCKSFMPVFQPSRVRKGKNNLDISWAYRSGISNRRGSVFNGFQLDSNAAIKFLEYVQSLHITGSKCSILGRKHLGSHWTL